MDEAGARIRVVIFQPALPKYRLPVFAELASRAGLDVCILYGSVATIQNEEGVGFRAGSSRLFRFGGRFLWQPGQVRHRALRGADAVVFGWNVWYLSLLPAIFAARVRGQAVVLWGHGYSKRERWWARKLRRLFARLADAVVFYSHGARDAFVREGLKVEKTHVALNSLDQSAIRAARDAWRADGAALRSFREREGVDPSRTVLFVSRLSDDNGVDMLIDAAATLSERHGSLRVFVVGDGRDRGRLEAYALSRGVGDVVRFVGAIYGEEDLAPYFCSSRVFCYPKNIGLSILHAFGYGLPVVTSDKREAQNPEIEALVDGENGLTYRDGDTGDLVEKLDALLRDDALAERLSAAASRTVEERFTLGRMVDGMETAIRAACGRRGESADAVRVGGGAGGVPAD